MSDQNASSPKQGAVIGGWVCIGLGTALMFLTLLSFVLYLPLFLAAFVLGIVAISQRHLANGIPILLLSIVVPLVLGFGLGVYRAQEMISKTPSAQEMLSKTPSTGQSSQVDQSAPTKSTPTAEDTYIHEHMDLYDFQAKYMSGIYEGRVPVVSFKIKNKGNRSLDKVEVVVVFKDSTGSPIAEESYLPVLVTEHHYSDDKPLKPGYIWQQEHGNFYTAKSVPSEWQEGAADAKITEIRFSAEGQ